MNQPQEGYVSTTVEIRINGILMHQRMIPSHILGNDIIITRYYHRRDKHHGAPDKDINDKFPFMPGEEEECQPHYSIKLHERAKYYPKSRPAFLFFFYTAICSDNHSSRHYVELLHKQSRKQFVGTKPIYKYLYAFI